jgi:hypothetical protein
LVTVSFFAPEEEADYRITTEASRTQQVL